LLSHVYVYRYVCVTFGAPPVTCEFLTFGTKNIVSVRWITTKYANADNPSVTHE